MERERKREKRFVFSFPISLVEHLPQGNVSENARLQIEVRLSLVQSRWVYSASTSAAVLLPPLLHIEKKKRKTGCGSCTVGWMDNIPKGLARLLLVKTSVSKWRTALIYFHLLFFPRYFFVGFYPLPHPVLYRLDEARFPPIPQVGSIFTLGWFTSIYIRPLNKFIFHLCFNANLHKQKRGDPIKQSRDNKKQNKRKTKREL